MKACTSMQPAVLTVQSGKKYLVKDAPTRRPSRSSSTYGTLVAPKDTSAAWSKQQSPPRWIRFDNVERLITVTGKGAMDGNGGAWWKSSCRTNRKHPCTVAPTALSLSSCDHLMAENIKILINSPADPSVG
ncbi:hypothetical protein PR202_ga17970 [Eleusine coracana subsp. coracana]|uniref:Uncharacterized protein n=1 Tax=Eleusine coracana subsp. coracana TaxID=191504 RepID=A0AAV5CRY5_ELECO|nr:hypothetical protein PR202_ga17970 [Eleusine coracana subsp. coracana]